MPRFAANLTMMYTEYSFLDRFAAAAADGFEAVEFLFPYDYPAGTLAGKLRDHGLNQVLFNGPPGELAGGRARMWCSAGPRGRVPRRLSARACVCAGSPMPAHPCNGRDCSLRCKA